MEELKIKTEFHPIYKDIIIIQLAGYIDQTNSGQVEKIILDILKTGKSKFVFDFRDLIYMSSAGWGVFVGEIKMVRDRGGDIKIAAMSPEVYEVFQMLEFYHIIQEFPTVEDAVESFPNGAYRPKLKTKVDSPEGNIIDELLVQSGVKSSVVTEDKENIVFTDIQPEHKKTSPEIIAQKKQESSVAVRETAAKFQPRFDESAVDIAKLPLNEKLKKVVSNYPLLNIFQIRKMLQHEKFGSTKISLFKLYSTLKFLNLENKRNRYRYYRSV